MELGGPNDDYAESLPETIERLEEELYSARLELGQAKSEIRLLNTALRMLKQFALDNGLDLASVGFAPGERPLPKKAAELTPDQIIERNELATTRQAGRHAKSTEALAQPTVEELTKLYEKRIEEERENNPAAVGIVAKFLQAAEKKEE
jgi:hypothetical protein